MYETSKEINPVLTHNITFEFSEVLQIPSHAVAAINLPKCSVVPGAGILWENIEIKFIDLIINKKSITTKMIEWLDHQEEGSLAPIDINIKMGELTEWKLVNCRILSIDFGEYNYNKNEEIYITVVIEFDDCALYFNRDE